TPQRGAVRREQPAVLVGERLGNTALGESPPIRRQPRKEIFDRRLEPAVFEKRDRGSPALAQNGGSPGAALRRRSAPHEAGADRCSGCAPADTDHRSRGGTQTGHSAAFSLVNY